MPGELIHTNEIMVLLGDNWFAERSATQAMEIAKRRLKSKSDPGMSKCNAIQQSGCCGQIST